MPRRRTPESDSATSGNPRVKPRAARGTRSGEAPRNGNGNWTPRDTLFLCKARSLRYNVREIPYRIIANHLGRTEQACRLELMNTHKRFGITGVMRGNERFIDLHEDAIIAECQAEARERARALAAEQELEEYREARRRAEAAAERAAAERVTAERINAEHLAAERLAAERLAAERLAAERLAAERLAAERLAAERLATERLAAERLIAERDATERITAERAASLAYEEARTAPRRPTLPEIHRESWSAGSRPTLPSFREIMDQINGRVEISRHDSVVFFDGQRHSGRSSESLVCIQRERASLASDAREIRRLSESDILRSA